MDSSYAAGNLRVSDAEREPVLERLQEAYAEGRIDHDEFDMRVHLAMTAKTRDDLGTVTRDLVPVQQRGALFPGAVPEQPTGEDRMLAAAAHAVAVPTLFVGPLVLMLLSGKRSEYVRTQAKEAVNFQVTLLLVTIVTFGVGGLLYAVAWILAAIAAVFALTGQTFRYPWILRLVR
ncbi:MULTISPECIES: DUF1707 and DUF4870 domain-containing protein [Actinomadura]|uniref:DUF1707 domain-containing protein n=1 Tax=Actinomadura litoris TaxID=2678616 RepID=A0A7K1KUR4_9ACTN|nr:MULTISPECIES: DUF1707 and DUF4870 domain-containing protein [Actinomadura]MBT2210961.1 DUF1707 domain-containing protein [Actinomadura sp. NEAU-AAG7]MUN35883.1 DUF1707 domain-containing protein [Actinomadura litoris]